MQTFLIAVDQHLDTSLNLINDLLKKSLNFSASYIVLNNDDQKIISNYKTTSIENHNFKAVINNDCPKTAEIISSNKHPFKGLHTSIKSLISYRFFSSDGNDLGQLILLDTKERILSADEKITLKVFAQTITNTIERHLENQQLQLVFTDFIHKTIHDLKNPLTSISLTTELLKRKADDPKMVNTFSEKIDKANKRLFSNLEELKSAFPIDNRSFKLNNTEINLSELLERLKIDSPNIDINIKEAAKINIFGDYDKLKEAAKQLISHIGSSSIDIKLNLNENKANIEITSNQIITDISTSALAISKILIQMHKGKINSNEKGYTIYLPVETS